ncbi:MAG TPA: tripartite tricarboxylate transporter substrate binding protein [Ramlibacter sp.]|uniref:tripartite tricarboxylate transporter substrate binding protein n=1 Tax=Ramlibacter sp. TaxID=1917967 RepID=UPI002ED09203
MMQTTRRLFGTVAAAVVAAAALPAFAQADAPLRVILPVGAGSGVDTIVRAAQNALARELKQPVVIENLPGAGGITGTAQLVKAAPDGRTIAFVSNNHAVNPSIFKKMPFDSLTDITPISVVGETPFVLVVNPSRLPVRNAKELAATLKASPGKFNYASSGNGTILHLASELFVDAADAKVAHIPYKGVGPMLTDIIGGQVDFGVVAVPSVQGHLKSGALRAVGVMGAQRVASLPELPTMKEQGFADVVIGGWFAAVGPAKLPAAEVKRIHTAVVNAWNAPEVKEAMARQENIIHPGTPEAATAFFKTEQARYARIVQKADIKAD